MRDAPKATELLIFLFEHTHGEDRNVLVAPSERPCGSIAVDVSVLVGEAVAAGMH